MFTQTRNKTRSDGRHVQWLLLSILVALIAAPGVNAQQDPNDPGAIDFVNTNIHAWGLKVDASAPLKTTLGADNPLQGMDLWLEIYSVDSGVIRFDSVHYRYDYLYSCLVNNPDMMPNRIVTTYSDGVLPDTVNIFMYGIGPSEVYDCATYDDWYMYYTGIRAGRAGIRGLGGNYGPNQETRFWVGGNPVDGDGDHYGRIYSTVVDVAGGSHTGGGEGQVPDPDGTDVLLINNDGVDQHYDVGMGFSSPVGVTLLWDEVITRLEFNFEISSVNAGHADFDSVVFAGPLGNPTTLPLRSAQVIGDGIYPDTIQITAEATTVEEYFEPEVSTDVRLIMYMYLTGVSEGDLTIVTLDGGGELENQTKLWSSEVEGWFCPIVTSESIPVVEDGGLNFNDPGERDVLTPDGLAIYDTQSSPINFRITNDEPIRYFTGIFEFSSPDGGLVEFDSIAWVGRLRSRSVCSDRRVQLLTPQTATSPGKVAIGCYAPHLEPYGSALPAGDQVAFQLFFSGVTPGTIEVDTATMFLSGTFRHAHTSFETLNEDIYCPAWERFSITSTEGRRPLLVQPDGYPAPFLAGGSVEFQVVAESDPVGHVVAIEYQSLVGWDDEYRTPSTAPDFDPGTGLFTWSAGFSDVGVWRASFRLTDTENGAVADYDVPVQVIDAAQFQIVFNTLADSAEGLEIAPPSGLVHGNFDQDAGQEVVFSPHYSPEWLTSILLYEYSQANGFHLATDASYSIQPYNRGLVAGFFNNDAYLDLSLKTGNALQVLLGNGDNTFSAAENPAVVPSGTFVANTLSNFNGDAYLDNVIMGTNEVYIHPGTVLGPFGEATTIAIGPVSDEATLHALNSADFDGDGWDDLAVSTVEGLWIYLNDQAGGYALAFTYPMEFPSVDISVTNEGADFNGDGYYDLCVTQPLSYYYWDADATRITVYLGNGDGSFSSTEVVVVAGLSLVNQTGDFNNDGLLDIAFINYNDRYLGILYGDAAGSFANQQRFEVPRVDPFTMDCMDIDADGDLDVVVEGHNSSEQWHYLYLNRIDPGQMINADLQIRLRDNALVQLVAPSGGRLSTIANSIASGEIYRRDIDGNDYLDAVATVVAVEPGRYDLVVKPGAVGGTFSLDYRLGGQTFAIARDLPVSTETLVFPIFPDGNSAVTPLQGGCVRSTHPMFEWDSSTFPGPDRQSSLPITDIKSEFRVATDPSFTDPFESATVTGTRYYLKTELSPDDTVSYFWQIRAEGATDWGPIFAFNALPVSDQDKDPADHDSNSDPGDELAGDVDPVGETTAESKGEIPREFALAQNYPNPFNPITEIAYSIPVATPVRLEVYNILGRRVTTLVDGFHEPGEYLVGWEAGEVASGIYFYRLTTDSFIQTRKMILLK